MLMVQFSMLSRMGGIKPEAGCIFPGWFSFLGGKLDAGCGLSGEELHCFGRF